MAKLGEIFNLQMGKTPARNNSAYWQNGEHKWVSIADLGNFKKYTEDTKEKITELAVSETGIKAVPANTVIMSFKLSLGKTAITKESIFTNEAIMAFIPTGSFATLPDYFYYLFSGIDWTKETKRAVMGATLNKNTLSKITISVPPLEEQQKIAAVLDKVTDLIDKRKQQLAKLDELIKSRFVEMFGDPVRNPNNFEKKMLKDSCKIITGNTPSRMIKENYGDYIEWIKTDNIIQNIINPTKASEYLSEKGVKLGKTTEKNSILMCCIAGSLSSIGRVCITDRKVAFNQQINAIYSEKYNIFFLYILLQLSKDYLTKEINMALKGILSKSKLERKIFIVPPLDLQKQFAEFVEQTEKIKVAINHSLDKLKTLKKALMQKYFG